MLTTKETAAKFNLTGRAVLNYIKDGRVSPQMVGNQWIFEQKDIDDLARTILRRYNLEYLLDSKEAKQNED
jgi:hypothetical protein